MKNRFNFFFKTNKYLFSLIIIIILVIISCSQNKVDKVLFGNSTIVAENKNAGASFFVNNRDREWYDHNSDNYSELPILKDNTFGANFFFLPSENQKIEVNFASIHEFRYGGEMVSGTAHFAMQAEERIHDILLGNVDYQINFNNESR